MSSQHATWAAGTRGTGPSRLEHLHGVNLGPSTFHSKTGTWPLLQWVIMVIKSRPSQPEAMDQRVLWDAMGRSFPRTDGGEMEPSGAWPPAVIGARCMDFRVPVPQRSQLPLLNWASFIINGVSHTLQNHWRTHTTGLSVG